MLKLRVVVLALVVAVAAAGCGGTSAPSERVGAFVTRILREEINGQWAEQWKELHPAHQQLITRTQYVTCSRQIGTDIATGGEIFKVLDVRDAPIDVAHVPQHTSKLVTISLRQPGSTGPLTYRVHAVAVGGRWAWVLGQKFLSQLSRGRCLDGSRLRGSA